MERGHTLAIDLGGSKLLLALIEAGRVLDRMEVPTDRAAGPEAWVAQMAALARAWTGRFVRAGITVTGLVKDNLWQALNPETLAIPGRFALYEAAKRALGVPITLCNDAHAAAWGEHVQGAGQGKDIVFLTISTGIGGGVVSGGQLLRGRGGLAASFGQHLPQPEGPEERFEDGASGRWIAAQGAMAGLPDDARAVFAAAADGQDWAGDVVQTSAGRVARLCQNLQLTFDPDVFVIGGGVGLAPGYMDRMVASVAHVPPLLRPAFVLAALGKNAGVIGVADLSTRNQSNREDMK